MFSGFCLFLKITFLWSFERYLYTLIAVSCQICKKFPWSVACLNLFTLSSHKAKFLTMSNWERSTSRLYIFTLLIKLICRVQFSFLFPLLLLPSIFPSIRVFSSDSVLHIRWPKYWRFSFSISPSNEYSGLISFRIDWFDLVHHAKCRTG